MKPNEVNYRVVVHPEHRWRLPTRDDCREIEDAINRHVDNVRDTDIICDYACPYCGGHWDVVPVKDGPPCCDEAQEQWQSDAQAK